MKYLQYFVKAVLAGICISIGGTVYLSCDNKVVGSLLFSLGLFTIVNWGLNLFTGKIGFLAKDNWLEILITLLGNFAGTNLTALALRATRIYPTLTGKLDTAGIVAAKLNDGMPSIFILSVMCGILMYIAVATFKRKPDILGAIAVVMCVSVFILSGFEHCVANMFYFALGTPVKEYIVPLLVMTAGNSVGAIALHHLIRFGEKEREKKKNQ